MNAIGDRLYIFGGRNTAGIVGDDDSSLLVVYDVIANHWLRPPVSGKAPSPRSSHRTVVMGNRIILYGGASAGAGVDCVSGAGRGVRSSSWCSLWRVGVATTASSSSSSSVPLALTSQSCVVAVPLRAALSVAR
jgi:hypothetical protein